LALQYCGGPPEVSGMNPVVVGRYNSLIPSAWYAWVFKAYTLPLHHCSVGI